MLSDAHKTALIWLHERSGDGIFDKHGVVLAAGERAPFMRSTWNLLRNSGLIEFYNPTGSGRGRLRITAAGTSLIVFIEFELRHELQCLWEVKCDRRLIINGFWFPNGATTLITVRTYERAIPRKSEDWPKLHSYQVYFPESDGSRPGLDVAMQACINRRFKQQKGK